MKFMKYFYKCWVFSLGLRFTSYMLLLTFSVYVALVHIQTSAYNFAQYQNNPGFQGKLGHARRLTEYLSESVTESNGDTAENQSQHYTDDTYSDTEDRNNIPNPNKLRHSQNNNQNTSRHYGYKSRRLPKALIIGVKKCGTRALLEYLRIHPEIKAPGPEPHFFDRYYHLGLDWYRDKMPNSYDHQITMEKTPRYFVNSDAPYRIWNMSREIKLIIVVRNPVTRAISDFTQGATKQHYLHSSVFKRKAFRSNGTGVVNTHWSIINTGIYAQHLRRWLKYFPLEQIYFVSGENLISEPAKEMEGVQDFLGITRVINENNFYFNATKGFPCLKRHARNPSDKCFNSKKGRHHLDLDSKTLRKLKTFYEPLNQEFYQISGRNFKW